MQHTNQAPTTSPAPAAAAGRFGMPQALVLVAYLAAAVTLSLTAHMPVHNVAILLGAAGTVSVTVLLAASVKEGRNTGGGRGLLRRLLNAALANSSSRS
ncbi:hypothetical protein AB0K89_26270 [Streptomyces cinnamoneus]|uniref:hypothetical protein n=1 Tax=Streptomyces cinnamoneus TaxID=53446 RepID=UPI0034402569